MKTLLLILLYIGTFIGVYLLLSVIGVILGYSYTETIRESIWFFNYSLYIGWWISVFPCHEYYKINNSYFSQIYK